jgi:hypothetical protein
MKLDKHDPFDGPARRSLADLQPTEIIGQIENPVLETVRRRCWRVFDRACGCFWSLRLSILDLINGPEPETPADP